MASAITVIGMPLRRNRARTLQRRRWRPSMTRAHRASACLPTTCLTTSRLWASVNYPGMRKERDASILLLLRRPSPQRCSSPPWVSATTGKAWSTQVSGGLIGLLPLLWMTKAKKRRMYSLWQIMVWHISLIWNAVQAIPSVPSPRNEALFDIDTTH